MVYKNKEQNHIKCSRPSQASGSAACLITGRRAVHIAEFLDPEMSQNNSEAQSSTLMAHRQDASSSVDHDDALASLTTNFTREQGISELCFACSTCYRSNVADFSTFASKYVINENVNFKRNKETDYSKVICVSVWHFRSCKTHAIFLYLCGQKFNTVTIQLKWWQRVTAALVTTICHMRSGTGETFQGIKYFYVRAKI